MNFNYLFQITATFKLILTTFQYTREKKVKIFVLLIGLLTLKSQIYKEIKNIYIF